MSTLTPRQKEVCELVIQGLTNKEVGRRLGISHRTVEDHREGIFKAYGVHNAVGLLFKLNAVTAPIENESARR